MQQSNEFILQFNNNERNLKYVKRTFSGRIECAK